MVEKDINNFNQQVKTVEILQGKSQIDRMGNICVVF